MPPLRFALIGCGKIAKKHATALQRIDDAVLATVYDRNADTARAFGAEHDVPAYDDCDALFAREAIDVVSILTPSGDHGRRALALAHYGKHLVIEKPMALRLDEADAVIRACDAAGARLFVVNQNRCNRPIRALKDALDAGRFGKAVLGTVRVRWCRPQAYYDAAPWRGTWAMDGGVLSNQAQHHLDMLEWLMGDVESVQAQTATRLAAIEAEDTAAALLRFASGALGIVEATTATRPKDLEGSISILGERGSVVVGGFAMNQLETWQFADARPEDATIFETHGANPSDFAWNHTEYLRGVVEAIRSGGRALVDGLEGRRSLELINALYESAETGRAVALRFKPERCRLGRTGEARP